MKIIELTSESGNKFYVNTNHIVVFHKFKGHSNFTKVYTTEKIEVVETPEEIKNLIEN